VANTTPLPCRSPNRGELAAATAAFLDHADLAPNDPRIYHASLAALVDALGPRPMPESPPSSWSADSGLELPRFRGHGG
jgi:hypothetical protein